MYSGQRLQPGNRADLLRHPGADNVLLPNPNTELTPFTSWHTTKTEVVEPEPLTETTPTGSVSLMRGERLNDCRGPASEYFHHLIARCTVRIAEWSRSPLGSWLRFVPLSGTPRAISSRARIFDRNHTHWLCVINERRAIE
jgi:hypothetical protein